MALQKIVLLVALLLALVAAFTAIPVAETAMTLSALVLFRGGGWKRKVI